MFFPKNPFFDRCRLKLLFLGDPRGRLSPSTAPTGRRARSPQHIAGVASIRSLMAKVSREFIDNFLPERAQAGGLK